MSKKQTMSAGPNIATQISEHLGVGQALFQKQLHGGSWDELATGIEPNVRQQIADTASLVALAHRTVREAGMSDAEYDALCQLAMRDLHSFTDRFLDVVDERAGRTGKTKSPEEFTEYMSLGVRLTNLLDELQGMMGSQLFVLQQRQAKAIDFLSEKEAAEEAAKTDAEKDQPAIDKFVENAKAEDGMLELGTEIDTPMKNVGSVLHLPLDQATEGKVLLVPRNQGKSLTTERLAEVIQGHSTPNTDNKSGY